jgi:hypothetical protein
MAGGFGPDIMIHLSPPRFARLASIHSKDPFYGRFAAASTGKNRFLATAARDREQSRDDRADFDSPLSHPALLSSGDVRNSSNRSAPTMSPVDKFDLDNAGRGRVNIA